MNATGITIKHYLVGEMIRNGNVYLGRHTQTGEEVEIKLEPVQAEHPVLPNEARIHTDVMGIIGIPSIHWFGSDGLHNAMITDLLVPALEDLLRHCHKRFSLKTVLLLATQILTRLEDLHTASYIHSKITPSSLFMGLGKWGCQVRIADLDHAKKYMVQGSHNPNHRGKLANVTSKYTSPSMHHGIADSPRDDLEALAYMMYYFCRGRLPWQGGEDIELLMEQKRNEIPEGLFHGFPVEFRNYFEYVLLLNVDEKPDYNFLRIQLRSLSNRNPSSTTTYSTGRVLNIPKTA